MKEIRCPVCLQHSGMPCVHGHGQCSICGTKIEECYSGESCAKIVIMLIATKSQMIAVRNILHSLLPCPVLYM